MFTNLVNSAPPPPPGLEPGPSDITDFNVQETAVETGH